MVITIFFILSFLALIVYFYRQYSSDLFAAQTNLARISSHIFHSTSGDIEYYLVGKGPTVLISHGITGGIDQGMGLSRVYLGDKYQFLYISRFGYLKSAIPDRPTSRLQASAYKELLDHLGIKKTYIFGNSAGGPSAMHFSLDYPNQCLGLILLSSAVPGANPISPPDFVFKSDFIYWLVTKIAAQSLMKIFIPPRVMKGLKKSEKEKIRTEIFAASLPISHRSIGIIFDNHISNPSVDTIPFDKIRIPTLIIHALDDPAPPIAGARQLAALIKGSCLAVYDGGHLLLHREDEIKQTITEFIKRTSALSRYLA